MTMEGMDTVANLIILPNGFPQASCLHPALLVKPGQTGVQSGSSGPAFGSPCHILCVPRRNAQRIVVCFDSEHRDGYLIRNPQSAIRNFRQTPSNLVKVKTVL
jgi:hypothetical protein